MPKLKAEFQKPKLTLCNTNYVPLGILTNKTQLSAHNIVLSSSVNETPILSFDMPIGGLIDINSTELLVKHKFDYFVIKEVSLSDTDIPRISVRAEHIACELKGIMVGYFEELIGETPENMWKTVVDSTTIPNTINNKYIFETNIVNTFRYLEGEEEKSVFEHLITIAQRFDACILFSTDANGKIHINLLYGDINRGKFVRKGKDLKQLNITFNTESLFTKMTPFGGEVDGMEVNVIDSVGKSYITNYDYYLAKGMTQAEIDASPLCNQECIYRNADILDESELLRVAREELAKISVPTINGSVDAIDLNVLEGNLYLSPTLCEKILVIDKDINYNMTCKITAIEFTYENPLESKITVSNVVQYSSKIKDLIHNSERMASVITNGKNGKPNLNASKVVGLIDGHIAQLKYSMEDSITDITDAVVLFENRIEGSPMFGALAIGSRGILISKQLDLVTNQWVWTTAMDANGLSTQVVNAIEINGSQIKGDVISSYDGTTWINLNDGSFNFKNKVKFENNAFTIDLSSVDDKLEDFRGEFEDYKKEVDQEIGDISEELEELKNNIDDVVGDGIITKSELVVIQDSIKQLDKEKNELIARYNQIYSDSYLGSSTKSELKTAYDQYMLAHTNLVTAIENMVKDWKATEDEKTQFNSHSTVYNTRLGEFAVALDKALKNIADNKTQYQISNLNKQLSQDIAEVEKQVDSLVTDLEGTIADGLIDEAELLIIKNSINDLNREKEDIDMIYTTLSDNTDLSGNAKTNLDTCYSKYTKTHNDLVTQINNMIVDGVVGTTERSDFENKLRAYSTALANFDGVANVALNYINQNYTNVKFEILEDSISSKIEGYEVLNYIDNIVIGGRNLAQMTSSQYCTAKSDFNGGTNQAKSVGKVLTDGLAVGDTVSVAMTYKYTDIKSASGKTAQVWLQGSGNVTQWNSGSFGSSSKYNLSGSGEIVIKYNFTINSNHLSNKYWDVSLRHEYVLSGSVQWCKFKVEKGTKCTDWSPAPEDTDSAIVGVIEITDGLQEQVDGKIQTYSQSTDPSSSWNAEQKIAHEGDIWYNTSTKITYRWNKTSWQKLTDADAEQAKSIANSKAQVFTSEPKPPYYEGDLWAGGTTSDLMRCVTTRTSGSYTASDWQKAVKYTDDTTVNSVKNDLANNYYNRKDCENIVNESKDAVLRTMKSTYTTKDELGNTLGSYVTQADYSKTSEAWEAKFKLDGNNLLLNGRPRTNMNYWHGSYSTGTTNTITMFSGGCNWNGEYFKSGIWWEGNRAYNSSGTWCCLWNKSISSFKFNTTSLYSISLIIHNAKGSKNITFRICDGNGINIVAQKYVTIANGYQYVNIDFKPSMAGNAPMLGLYLEDDGDYKFYIPWAVVREGGSVKTWIPNADEVEEGKTTITKDGITVTNGGLTIKNNSGTAVFSADTNGNLNIEGTFKNGSNGYSTTLNQGGLIFQRDNEIVGGIRSGYFADTGANGTNIVMTKNGEYLDLGYTDSETLVGSATFVPMVRLTKAKYSNMGNFIGTQFVKDVRVNTTLYLYSGTNYDNQLFGSSTGYLCAYGDNGVSLGYLNGNSRQSLLELGESADSLGAKIQCFGNINLNGNSIYNQGRPRRISNMNAFLGTGWYVFGSDCTNTPVGWGVMFTCSAFGSGSSQDMCQLVWGTDNSFRIRWYVNGAYTAWKIW